MQQAKIGLQQGG